MKQSRMASALDTALARGLDVLTGATGNGEIFRVHGASAIFSASLTSQIVPDEIGGCIMETVLCVARSAFTSLPAEGTVIERADASESFRVAECRPGAGGFIDIVVRHAQT